MTVISHTFVAFIHHILTAASPWKYCLTLNLLRGATKVGERWFKDRIEQNRILSFKDSVEPTGKDIVTHGQRGVILLHSYHLNTLHEWQPHSLVTNQRHHAGWGGRWGLQQGQHRLHAHAAGLQDEGYFLFKDEQEHGRSFRHSITSQLVKLKT